MSNNKNNRAPDASIVAKAGLWYTVCNFLFKGMVFITTPIFSRILTKNELGSFNNFSSWVVILTALTALDLQSSIIRSKLEHDEDMDSYILSILSITTVVTAALYGVVLIFQNFFVGFFEIDIKYIHVMFAYLLVTPAYQMLITKQRAYYKYKNFVALTGITIISSTLLSLLMVCLMEDKYAGRLLGNYIPYIVIGAAIYVLLVKKGKRIKLKYWKYAGAISLPLVPHVLSMYLLSSSDKIIITKICGSECTAIYSIAYSCYHIVTILADSMNKAWAPWLMEALHSEKYGEIKKISKKYILVFTALAIGILMLVPEIIYILGGKQYKAAIYCLPPLVMSCLFQFIYTMYVNIEFYEKKTIGVAGATMIATVLNIALNLILIPLDKTNGHVIAAYTTLIGYMALLVLHYILVKKMNMDFVYDIKFVVMMLIGISVLAAVMNILYGMLYLRYALILLYGMLVIGIVIKQKNKLLAFFR